MEARRLIRRLSKYCNSKPICQTAEYRSISLVKNEGELLLPQRPESLRSTSRFLSNVLSVLKEIYIFPQLSFLLISIFPLFSVFLFFLFSFLDGLCILCFQYKEYLSFTTRLLALPPRDQTDWGSNPSSVIFSVSGESCPRQ